MNKPRVTINDKDEANPVSSICLTLGIRCAGLYCVIRALADDEEPITIFGLASDCRMSPEKVRQYVRALRDAEWIEVDGDFDRGERAPKTVAEEGIVYLLHAGGRYKIGITDDMERRLEQLNGRQSPFPVEEVFHVRTKRFWQLERMLHERFELHRVHGEWFEFKDRERDLVVALMDAWAKQP